MRGGRFDFPLEPEFMASVLSPAARAAVAPAPRRSPARACQTVLASGGRGLALWINGGARAR